MKPRRRSTDMHVCICPAWCSQSIQQAGWSEPELMVPDAFPGSEHALSDAVLSVQDAVETFLHYLYYDSLDPRSSPQHVVAVLHVAHYYGASHLVGLCEATLAKVLKKGDQDDEGQHPLKTVLSLVATAMAADMSADCLPC